MSLVAACLVQLAFPQEAGPSQVPAAVPLDEVVEGHWVELRGAFAAPDVVQVEDVRIVAPGEDEKLIGVVTFVAEDGSWFEVLGQRVRFDAETAWRDVTLQTVLGARVAVEGRYHDPRKFSADEVALRTDGRDRIVGRVDAVRRVGGAVELDVMRFRAVMVDGFAYRREVELGPLALVPKRAPSRSELAATDGASKAALGRRDDDDDIPISVRLTDDLALGLRFELRHREEHELDLDPTDDEDRVDDTINLRSELVWRPDPNLLGLFGIIHEWRWRDDGEDGYETRTRSRVNEAYLYWKDVRGSGWGLQVGRQDFDEEREWLWDENLDAFRAHWAGNGLRLQLAAATFLSDGNEVEEATDYLMAYLTNDDDDAVWGAYALNKDTDLSRGEDTLFYGLRAYGDWLEGHSVWAELAFVDGEAGGASVDGFGFDVGTTWSPSVQSPWYFIGGFASGSGDDDLSDGEDGTFRQTGLNDNNARFGGVTSFRYYGEAFDPHLSNLSILTLGVGRRFGEKVSLDVVYHQYRQDVALDSLGESDIDADPNGLSRELGDEVDVVFGARGMGGRDIDLEFVLGAFFPGSAFDLDEPSWLAQFQLRFGI